MPKGEYPPTRTSWYRTRTGDVVSAGYDSTGRLVAGEFQHIKETDPGSPLEFIPNPTNQALLEE